MRASPSAFRWILPIAILLMGGAGFIALQRSAPQPVPLTSKERAWNIAVLRAEPSSLAPTLTLYGRVDSPRVAHLTAAVTADVQELHVLEGQAVEAQSLLIRLDDREATLLLEQRKAELADIQAQALNEQQRFANDVAALEHEKTLLALSRKEVGRARELANSQVGSRSQLDQARQAEVRQALAIQQREFSIRGHDSLGAQFRARIVRARALVRRAQLDVRRTRVMAPFSGRITSVDVTIGDRVRAGDRLLEMYDTSTVEIRAQIPTGYLGHIRDSLSRGTPLVARAVVDERPVAATLDRLSARVAPGSGGADGLFRLSEGNAWLQLGRVVELVLELPPEHDVVALPMEALYGLDRIYQLDGERMAGLRVTRIGELRTPDGASRVLVRSPEIRPGARIIVTQLPNAIDGLRVRVIDQ